MPRAYVALVLHAHLPFVRHPECENAAEENWLFEAISETYLPLLNSLQRLQAEGHDFRLTLCVSPTLATMLTDPYLQQRYVEQLQGLCRLTEAQAQYHQGTDYQAISAFYRDWFADTLENYEQDYQRDLLAALRRLQQTGVIELISTAATHAYLPLLRVQPAAVAAQIHTAVASHQNHFQQAASGFWLPECAYYPGLEAHLQAHDLSYFFLDSHGLLNAQPAPHYGIYAPVRCSNGVWAYARDPACSAQVWSAQHGYPGDADYREFYQDQIHQISAQTLSKAGLPTPCFATGLKYHRITGTAQKQVYRPQQAAAKARQHAADFLQQRLHTAAHLRLPDRPPLFVASYDAELFGHWWFEGVDWLENLVRLSCQQGDLEFISPSQYQQRHPHVQTLAPAASSWGAQGYHEVWLNASNDWIYPQLHQALQRLQAAIQTAQQKHSHTAGHEAHIQRSLRQAARSLLLAQASDWAFILKNNTTVEYASRRIQEALAQLHYLLHNVEQGKIDEQQLQQLEAMDRIFTDIAMDAFVQE